MKAGNFNTIFCAWLASLSLGQAATQLPLTIETLAGKAEAVVHGKVKGMTCKRDATGRIFTEVQLKLTETLKGKPNGEVFRLVHGGGILGGKRSRSVADPKFKIGEEVVVFVVFNSRGEAIPVGMNQGRFEVFRPVASGEAMVRNPFHGLAKRNDGVTTAPLACHSRRCRFFRRRFQPQFHHSTGFRRS